MQKIITGLSATGSETRAALQDRVLNDLALQLAATAGVRKLTVNLVQDPPSFVAVPPANPDAPKAFDVVVMTWLEDGAAVPAALLADGARSFLVDEIVARDEIPMAEGKVTPGIRNVPMMVVQDHLDDAGFREAWRVHGELGLRIHTGMKRYVRNMVVRELTPAGPTINGFAEVGFPTLDDLQHGLFPTPDDRAAFLADVSGWVKASGVQYGVEHVIRWPQG